MNYRGKNDALWAKFVVLFGSAAAVLGVTAGLGPRPFLVVLFTAYVLRAFFDGLTDRGSR